MSFFELCFLQNSLYHDDFEGVENTKINLETSAETLRARAAMVAAVSVSKTPKISIHAAGPNRLSDLCPTQYNPNFIFRWPTSTNLRTGLTDEVRIIECYTPITLFCMFDFKILQKNGTF